MKQKILKKTIEGCLGRLPKGSEIYPDHLGLYHSNATKYVNEKGTGHWVDNPIEWMPYPAELLSELFNERFCEWDDEKALPVRLEVKLTVNPKERSKLYKFWVKVKHKYNTIKYKLIRIWYILLE